MTIDLKTLRALMTLCRSKGVDEITFGGVSLKFGDMPQKPGKQDDTEDAPDDPMRDPLTGLTLEELANYSVPNGGIP